MNKSISYVAAIVGMLVYAGPAQAQTASTLTIVSGNGQVICQCPYGGPTQFFFAPLQVRVTDAAGAPMAGIAVDWVVVTGGNGGGLLATQTVTDPNGVAINQYTPGPVPFAAGLGSYLQTTVRATSGAGRADFVLTQGAQAQPTPATGGIGFTPFVGLPAAGSLPLSGGVPITGQVGSTVTPPIRITVGTQPGNQPIPNVAIFIQNDQTADQGPVLSCASQPGAGPNVVLTDSTGVATCNPVFSGVPNVNGTARVIVGGAIPASGSTAGETYPFTASQTFSIRATPGAPGQIRQVSGNSQTAQAGQALASPLVVEVLSSGGAPMAGQNVNWTVSPPSSGVLTNSQTSTDATGRATNTLRLTTAANGTVVITAAIASDTTKSTTFTAIAVPLVTVTSLQIVSGNNQNAALNSAFQPLVVQVNSTAGPAAGVAVSFSITGPGTLSASSATTGPDGQAQVNVQAGGTTGAVTVTASAAGFSQSFNLTVSPPAPQITAANFYNAADLQRGKLSPCSLATIIGSGIAGNLQGMVTAGIVGQLPGNLANTSVTVGGTGAPLSSVGRNANGQETITFQVPCEATAGSSVPVVINAGGASVSVNIPLDPASPGIFTQTIDGVTRAVVIRPEGSFVSPSNPARRGENLTALVTGLGPSIPVVGTNSVAAPGSITAPQGTVVVGMAGRGVPLISAQMSPDQVGVWLVQFTVPGDIGTGNQNFSVSVIPSSGSSGPISSGSAVIPVQ